MTAVMCHVKKILRLCLNRKGGKQNIVNHQRYFQETNYCHNSKAIDIQKWQKNWKI